MLPFRKRLGLTVMELCVVVAVIGILSLLLWPLIGWYRKRALAIGCTENLKGLYTATSSYLSANNFVWPQIPYSASQPQENAREWHDLLQPYGLAWINWVCPEVQSKIGSPDVSKRELNRSDYIAMRFDAKPGTPQKWSNQPWFAERQSIHAGGNLLILSNGRVATLREALQIAKQPQNP